MIRHKDYLLVHVPETAYSFQVLESVLDFCTKDLEAEAPIDLPPGTWQLIGLAAEITEEQKKEIVERWDNGKYADYERHLARVDTPDESFASLLRSHNFNENQTVILKLIEA